MAATIHAVLLILVVGGSGYLIYRYREWPESEWRVVPAFVIGVLNGYILGASWYHMCKSGDPFTQWLLPSVCLAAAWIFLGAHGKLRWGLSVLLVLSTLWLSQQYTDLVHRDGYTGNPDEVAKMARVTGHPVHVYWFWHTWFTGLYGIESTSATARTSPPRTT